MHAVIFYKIESTTKHMKQILAILMSGSGFVIANGQHHRAW